MAKQVLWSGDLERADFDDRKNWEHQRAFREIFRHTDRQTGPRLTAFPKSVNRSVRRLLSRNNTRKPYSHQAETARLFLETECNVSLVTPTASGKSIAFLAPALTLLMRDERAVVIILYPMNALAHDQARALSELGFSGKLSKGLSRIELNGCEITLGLLNGDTPEDVRTLIRGGARLILTNPVYLHAGILAQAKRRYRDGTSWDRVLENLAMMVIDEAHTQDGFTGTNTALALRRLWALLEAHGRGIPRLILTTATIANPLEHAKQLTSVDNWAMIDHSGAGSQRKEFRVILPNPIPGQPESLWPAPYIAKLIAVQAIERGEKVLVFANSRNSCERLAHKINKALASRHQKGKRVTYFHAAIPPGDKRRLTAEILAGRFDGVVSTSALELGVDIGDMDTVVILGHPGDQAGFFQRAGRVGRARPGTVYLILDEGFHPVNVYLQSDPEHMFGEPEARTVYPLNQKLVKAHGHCCLLETNEHMARRWIHPELVIEKELIEKGPHGMVTMLGGLGRYGRFEVVTPTGEPIQTLDGSVALTTWHPGAIVRNLKGEVFEVRSLDLGRRQIQTRALGSGEILWTRPLLTYDMKTTREKPFSKNPLAWDSQLTYLALEIHEHVTCYMQLDDEQENRFEEIPIPEEDQFPAIGFETRGMRFTIPGNQPLAIALLREGAMETLHQALKQTACLFVRVHRREIDIIFDRREHNWFCLIYDRVDGGMGWSWRLAFKLDAWLRAAGTLLERCSCRKMGCPKCAISKLEGAERNELIESLLSEAIRKRQ